MILNQEHARAVIHRLWLKRGSPRDTVYRIKGFASRDRIELLDIMGYNYYHQHEASSARGGTASEFWAFAGGVFIEAIFFK